MTHLELGDSRTTSVELLSGINQFRNPPLPANRQRRVRPPSYPGSESEQPAVGGNRLGRGLGISHQLIETPEVFHGRNLPDWTPRPARRWTGVLAPRHL